MKKVQFTETVLRDANQSLIATRLPYDKFEPILEKMDQAGFYSVECWGGATFDVCLRFLNNAAAHGAYVHAVIHADVQLKRKRAVIIEVRHNALGHRLASEKLERTAFLIASGHAFNAEAACGRRAGNIRKDLTGDAYVSKLIADIHHIERLLSSSIRAIIKLLQ